MDNVRKIESALENLEHVKIQETPEFAFVVALRQRLISNHFGPDLAAQMVVSQTVDLPDELTVEQAKQLGSRYADLVAMCYDELETAFGPSAPSLEACQLAKQLLTRWAS